MLCTRTTTLLSLYLTTTLIVYICNIVENIGIRQIRFTEIKERNFPRLIQAYIRVYARINVRQFRMEKKQQKKTRSNIIKQGINIFILFFRRKYYRV